MTRRAQPAPTTGKDGTTYPGEGVSPSPNSGCKIPSDTPVPSHSCDSAPCSTTHPATGTTGGEQSLPAAHTALDNPAQQWHPTGPNLVIHGDNLPFIQALPEGSFQVIYLDPPFNTGRVQQRQSLQMVRTEDGDRVGFKGDSYQTIRGQITAYNDAFDDYWGFLEPRLRQAWRLLKRTGTLYLHLDYREVHYAKVLLDAMFGRECFLNEIIWAYDYGARTKKRWPCKHDTILVYVKDPRHYHFNSEEVDREPYMAPGLVTPEKAARGKLPTDVWWHTIVSPTGREKTGYATQKPLGILRRIIAASSQTGDWVLDFFAGSGTTGAAAAELGRRFVLVDKNPQAIEVMRQRFSKLEDPPSLYYQQENHPRLTSESDKTD